MSLVPCIKEGGGQQVIIDYFDVDVGLSKVYDLTGIANYKNIIAILPGPLTGATRSNMVKQTNIAVKAGGYVASYTAGASTVTLGRDTYALENGAMYVTTRFFYVMVI